MAYKCWGIKSKNEEQKEAIKHLLDSNIDLVIIEGPAGVGKSHLAIAAALECVFNNKQYEEILFTRAPVGIGHDMGHLPGDINEKMTPWCGALFDNLEALYSASEIPNKLQREATSVFIQNRVKLCAMMHMRGRSLYNKWVIVDEVQNLTPEEVKVLLTRVGENTKLVLLGDTSQIDNKKLTKEYNGLAHILSSYEYTSPEYIKAIKLTEGVRSRLCNWGITNL